MKNEIKDDLECIIADLWVLLAKDAYTDFLDVEAIKKDATLRSLYTIYKTALNAYDKL